MASADITTIAHRVIAAKGNYLSCTAVASRAEMLRAAERALDGDTDDLELYLDEDAAETWRMPEWRYAAWRAERRAAIAKARGAA